jgi:ribosomal protein S18 acetylase RimI-like enzyme
VHQYFAELTDRFESGFDPALSIRADAADLTPPSGLLLVARRREGPLGCGALKFHAHAPAELKRMWVSPEARGLGLGRRLLGHLEQSAREAGATAVRLETNGALTEAIALYRQAGYAEVAAFNDEPYAHHWFEKRLTATPSTHSS